MLLAAFLQVILEAICVRWFHYDLD